MLCQGDVSGYSPTSPRRYGAWWDRACFGNADGSVDIVMGPSAPEGLRKNWIPTTAGRAWYPYFRLFGPLQPYFDRSWPLPDIALQDG